MTSAIFIVLFLSLGTVLGSPLFVSEEIKDNESLKVINGAFTTIDKYPINVAFLVANSIWGAGVIVGPQSILTTAFNCLWVDPSYITVRVGSTNWTTDGVIIPAEKCIMHPNYTGTWDNNVAVLQLTKKIKFGKNSKKGNYAPKKSLKVINATYDVSGWGVRSASYAKETQLQTISQTILDDSECEKYYNQTVGTFCASNPSGGPCVFDFGAPLNRKLTAVGLFLGSTDCTKPKTYPNLYLDVYQYRNWISSVITSK